MIIHHNITQGSQEWLALRRVRPTASEFSRILTTKTGELSASRFKYIYELIAACYEQEDEPMFENYWMRRGKELESQARDEYANHVGLCVEQIGFVTRDDGIIGCSPDGLIKGDNGEWERGLEMKCAAPWTHVQWMVEGGLPAEHKVQVHGGMAVTGLRKWDFWSWQPNMAPLHVAVEWDAFTDKLSAALDQFYTEYKQTFDACRSKLIKP